MGAQSPLRLALLMVLCAPFSASAQQAGWPIAGPAPIGAPLPAGPDPTQPAAKPSANPFSRFFSRTPTPTAQTATNSDALPIRGTLSAPETQRESRAVPSRTAPPPPTEVTETPALRAASEDPSAFSPYLSKVASLPDRAKLPEPELITGTVNTDTLRIGRFTLRPSVQVDVGYDSNPRRVPNAFAKGSSLISPAFKVDAESNWDKNAMTVNLLGRIFSYQQVESANRFDGVADLTYRYDINDSTWLFLNARASSLSQQSPETTVLAAPDATVNEVWGSARLLKKFGQYFASLGLWEGFTDVAQTPGRSYTTTLGALRGGYEVNDRFTPYVEMLMDRRNYETAYIDNIQRSSNGYQPTAGLSYKVNNTISTDLFAGYLWRDYDNALVKTTQWPVFGATGNWQISPRSSLQGRIRTGISETTVGGAFGAKENLVGVSWRQLIGERLALLATLDLSRADYFGVPGNQKRAFGEFAVEYAMTKYLVGRLSAQRDVMASTYRFNSYEANVFMAGLRVVR